MTGLVVLCHPTEKSLCHAIAETAANGLEASGWDVKQCDLYRERFNPVLTGPELTRRFSLDGVVQTYTHDILDATHLVFVHPDWWGGPPAMLKGWIDRVFRPGVAYDWEGEEFAEKNHRPLLTGRSATVFVTSDREPENVPSSIQGFWTSACEYAGISPVTVKVFPGVRASTLHTRRKWLEEVTSVAAHHR